MTINKVDIAHHFFAMNSNDCWICISTIQYLHFGGPSYVNQ